MTNFTGKNSFQLNGFTRLQQTFNVPASAAKGICANSACGNRSRAMALYHRNDGARCGLSGCIRSLRPNYLQRISPAQLDYHDGYQPGHGHAERHQSTDRRVLPRHRQFQPGPPRDLYNHNWRPNDPRCLPKFVGFIHDQRHLHAHRYLDLINDRRFPQSEHRRFDDRRD